MMGPRSTWLSGKRLHLQHGPIDLIIGAEAAHPDAFSAAQGRFASILEELVSELALLRRPVGVDTRFEGAVAARMGAAVRGLDGVFVTPMAAVAGAVAEEVLAAMQAAAPLRRAYVNNGGDIALHLSPNCTPRPGFEVAIAGPQGHRLGVVSVDAETKVRGLATSGLGGRSLSMGIADSVTVLARSAAAADVAATLIANDVDLPRHPAISRAPANALQPDSDLGARAVVTAVGELSRGDIRRALDRGQRRAQAFHRAGLIEAAALFLRGAHRMVGHLPMTAPGSGRVEHA